MNSRPEAKTDVLTTCILVRARFSNRVVKGPRRTLSCCHTDDQMKRCTRYPRFWVLTAIVPAAAPPVFAASSTQDPQEVVTTTGGPQVYGTADFARFAPKTALDMIRQVPGFALQAESRERGLGQASGNVLINGQRISGKSNDAVTALGRIPAAGVVRIEIVDGATLNVAGLSGQVANVIARSTGLSGQFQWRGEARLRNTKPLLTNGSASISGSYGRFAYTVGLRNDSFRRGNAGPTEIFSEVGELIDLRQEQALFAGERPRISGNFKYSWPGGNVGNLNLSYERFWFDLSERSAREGVGLPDRLRTVDTDQNRSSYEISGDYELAIGPGRLKLIGLHNIEHNPSDTLLVTAFADGAAATGNRFLRVGDEAETVGRAEYRWRGGANDWQLSAEGAFNSLDNASNLFVLLPDSTFAEIPLVGGTGGVTESRYEGAITWGRSVSPRVALQASVGGEYSQLSQTGSFGQTRIFVRPKGFLAAAWKATPRFDINARLERRVGQLNFGDFLASTNLGRESADAANPDLVPPQSWDGEIEATRKFGDWGTASAKIYSRLISDIIDQIPIGRTQESAGNIDQAAVYGIEWNSTVQLVRFGWAGAKVDARLQLQNSRLKDPLTGNPRRISNDTVRSIEINLRHDVPRSNWAWGGQLDHSRRAPSVRLGEISVNYEESPFNTSLFVEHKNLVGLTVRGSVRNLLGANDYLDRTVFVGRRGGAISFIEARNRSVGPTLSITVSGTL